MEARLVHTSALHAGASYLAWVVLVMPSLDLHVSGLTPTPIPWPPSLAVVGKLLVLGSVVVFLLVFRANGA